MVLNYNPHFFDYTPLTFDNIKLKILGLALNHVMTISTYNHTIKVKRTHDQFIILNDNLPGPIELTIEHAENGLLINLIKDSLSINDNHHVSCEMVNNCGETVTLHVGGEMPKLIFKQIHQPF